MIKTNMRLNYINIYNMRTENKKKIQGYNISVGLRVEFKKNIFVASETDDGYAYGVGNSNRPEFR